MLQIIIKLIPLINIYLPRSVAGVKVITLGHFCIGTAGKLFERRAKILTTVGRAML